MHVLVFNSSSFLCVLLFSFSLLLWFEIWFFLFFLRIEGNALIFFLGDVNLTKNEIVFFFHLQSHRNFYFPIFYFIIFRYTLFNRKNIQSKRLLRFRRPHWNASIFIGLSIEAVIDLCKTQLLVKRKLPSSLLLNPKTCH